MKHGIGLFSVGDIQTGTDVAQKFAFGGVTGMSLIVNPTVFAVETTQVIFQGKRPTIIDRLLVSFQAILEIVRMYASGPTVAPFLPQGAPGKSEPAR